MGDHSERKLAGLQLDTSKFHLLPVRRPALHDSLSAIVGQVSLPKLRDFKNNAAGELPFCGEIQKGTGRSPIRCLEIPSTSGKETCPTRFSVRYRRAGLFAEIS